MVQTKKIFLASSAELVEDRRAFEIQIGRRNNDWVPKGVHLHLVLWEDFLDVMTRDGLQKAYNRAVQECDLFVMLFWTKVGQYTGEEFATAFQHFQANHKPFILTYFKDAPINTGSASRDSLQSLWSFQDKLKALGHYQTEYNNTEGLLLNFGQQLDKLVANGFISFAPAAAASTSNHATLTGSGASAQGPGATAVGERGVLIAGNNTGHINTGTQTRIDTGGGAYVGGNVRVTGGDFVGRDKIAHGSPPEELAVLLDSLLKALREQPVAPALQAQAIAQVAALKDEVQKGAAADDSKLAGIVEGIYGLVPGAVGAVLRMFASPILQELIGPVTRYVLAKLK